MQDQIKKIEEIQVYPLSTLIFNETCEASKMKLFDNFIGICLPKQLFSPTEAAMLSCRSVQTIYNYIEEGKIKAYEINKSSNKKIKYNDVIRLAIQNDSDTSQIIRSKVSVYISMKDGLARDLIYSMLLISELINVINIEPDSLKDEIKYIINKSNKVNPLLLISDDYDARKYYSPYLSVMIININLESSITLEELYSVIDNLYVFLSHMTEFYNEINTNSNLNRKNIKQKHTKE